ncbi:hypothetical protein EVAR_94189_1 [Eumeta japonica]|uniref:Uncharacterized protein n=1 Tax=Eumeta variegata TaxID=151549 RepID=A0A4C1UPA7_EUMVA|nr:hypothetical protein EVAR_94189_1 [Eumeta japonica]
MDKILLIQFTLLNNPILYFIVFAKLELINSNLPRAAYKDRLAGYACKPYYMFTFSLMQSGMLSTIEFYAYLTPFKQSIRRVEQEQIRMCQLSLD